jgi:hypothetical protein
MRAGDGEIFDGIYTRSFGMELDCFKVQGEAVLGKQNRHVVPLEAIPA